MADLCDCGSKPRVPMSSGVGLYLTIQRLLASHEAHFDLVTSHRTIRCCNLEDNRLKKNRG